MGPPGIVSAGRTYALLYDGDCRICTSSARWAKTLDFRDRIRIRPIQGSRDLLHGIREDEILDAMHVVSPDGCVTTGGDSLPLLLEALVAGPPFAEIVRSSRGTMHALRRAYDVIARLRGHLVCRFPATADGSASTLR